MSLNVAEGNFEYVIWSNEYLDWADWQEAFDGEFDHCSEEEKFQLLYHVVEQLGLDMDDEKEFIQDLASEISNVKNNQLILSEYQSTSCDDTVFRKVYERYENERKHRRKIDFDDMLVLTHQLFTNRPDILKMWQKKYKYILINFAKNIHIKFVIRRKHDTYICKNDNYIYFGIICNEIYGEKRNWSNATF